MCKKIILLIILTTSLTYTKQREFISGNAFKNIADYVIDENKHNFKPQTLPPKSIIFIKTDFLGYFFNSVFPYVSSPIILISHNGDMPAPRKFVHYLDHPNIIAWFGQNCDCLPHPKFYPIPIGIANKGFPHGNPDIFNAVLNRLEKYTFEKKASIYCNLSLSTNPERKRAYEYFKNKFFVFQASKKPLEKYLYEMARCDFVLSPFGNGLDCHRTWEALLVGSIPIVKTSTLDPLYEDLPVVIVKNWTEVTENFLKEKLSELTKKKYSIDKLFMNYWRKKIISCKFNN